jgi:RND family efflux transporter MFP subunit
MSIINQPSAAQWVRFLFEKCITGQLEETCSRQDAKRAKIKFLPTSTGAVYFTSLRCRSGHALRQLFFPRYRNPNSKHEIQVDLIRRFNIILAVVALGLALSGQKLSAAELTLTGVIRAQEEVVVRSEAPGIVQRIAVREGERVREGQLLVELKNDKQKISVELSRGRLAKASASVVETKVLLDNARKEVERAKIAGDALPRKELEDRSDQVLRLEANLEAQGGELTQAKEELRLRERELLDTQLSAPFPGTVTQIYINRGDALKPMDTQVLELVAMDRLYVELLLPSLHAQKIHTDQKLVVHVESEALGKSGQVEGRVIYVNPKLDAASRTIKVKVSIPVNGWIRPGMLAQAKFAF